MTLDERLTLIAAHAPKLRTAGIQSIEIDGISLTLAPPDAPEPAKADEQKDPTSDADDPVTYGRTEHVPGFERPSDLPVRRRR